MDALSVMDILGASIGAQDRLDEAESLMLAALEAKIRVVGEDHPATAMTLYNSRRAPFFSPSIPTALETVNPDYS